MAKQRKAVTNSNRDFVALLYTKHNVWLSRVRAMDSKYPYPEDVVSLLYEQMLYWASDKMINKDGTINMSYIYTSLKNALILIKKKDNRVPYTELKDYHTNDLESEELEREAHDEICQKIEDLADTWSDDKKEAFNLYFTTRVSYRQLGEDLGLNWWDIFADIKECKDEIRDVLMDDYQDYLNGDFEQIVSDIINY